MKGIPTPLRIALIGLAFTGIAEAQSSANAADLSERGDDRRKWEAGFAAVGFSVPAYPAAEENRVLALPSPYFVYHGRVLRSDDRGSRLRRRLTPNVELSVSGGGALAADSDDTEARRGMPDLGYLLELGPNLRLSFDGTSPTSGIELNLPVRGVISIGDGGVNWRGALFAPELAFEERCLFGRPISMRTSLTTEFASGGLQRYFYDVAPEYATAERPSYRSEAGYLGSSLGTRLSIPLRQGMRMFLALRYYNYDGAANQDSPLFRSEHGYSIAMGFTWSLWRSSERALD